ncbi:hypothetical protein Bbelb_062480 [Branchiostoma belcheri]|nr:hypothetical protein Bbelb_062480 [Branchiostoma belcheri]
MAATGQHLTAIFVFLASMLSKVVYGNEYCRTSRDGYVTYYSIGLFSGAVVLLALVSFFCWRLKRKSRVEAATTTDVTESAIDLRSRGSIPNDQPAHFIRPPPYDPKNYYNDPPPAYPGSPSPPPISYCNDPPVPPSPTPSGDSLPPSGASPPPPYVHPTEVSGHNLPGQTVQERSSSDAPT